MYANTPVYFEQNGVHFVNIYLETEDGTFRRTQGEPLRLLRDNIKGISNIQGELLTKLSDRSERSWSSATVTFHYGRPQSIYRFLREMVARNKYFVFSKPQLSGRISRFNLHELELKPGTSQRHRSLLKEKYLESIQLWTQKEWEQKQTEKEAIEKAASAEKKPARSTFASLDVDFGQTHSEQSAQVPDSEYIDLETVGQATEYQVSPTGVEIVQGVSTQASVRRIGEISGSLGNDVNDTQFSERNENRRSHFLQRFIFTVD